MPRLSVDIDLNYCRRIDRTEMLSDRDIITDRISKYMTANGYTLSPKSKNYHALDSYVYEYVNCGGVKDNIKIPTEEEVRFWNAFREGRYCPELIFGATAEYENVENHPMALWKCRGKG